MMLVQDTTNNGSIGNDAAVSWSDLA